MWRHDAQKLSATHLAANASRTAKRTIGRLDSDINIINRLIYFCTDYFFGLNVYSSQRRLLHAWNSKHQVFLQRKTRARRSMTRGLFKRRPRKITRFIIHLIVAVFNRSLALSDVRNRELFYDIILCFSSTTSWWTKPLKFSLVYLAAGMHYVSFNNAYVWSLTAVI